MTRNSIQIVTLTAALGLFGVFAMGQTATAPQSGAEQVHNATDDSAEKLGKWADEMGKETKGMMAKMPDDLKMRCQMQMNMEVSPSDPGAILAFKDQLQLTTDQTTELEAIGKEARTRAVAVLNPDQQTTLESLPQSPQTMKDMHKQLIGQMQTMPPSETGDQRISCPLMQMMQDSTESPIPPLAAAPVAFPAAKPAIDTTVEADVMGATDTNTVKATELLGQLQQYTTDNKTDLAEKTLKQLDGMKGSLPASLQGQIETARAALKAKKAVGMLQ